MSILKKPNGSDDIHITKKYLSSEITVEWKPYLCAHSGNCIRQLSSVFDSRRRPWIDLSQATEDETIKAIETCPSGALSYYYHKQDE